MLMPALDLRTMLKAAGFITTGSGYDVYIGPTVAISEAGNRVGTTKFVPKNALFIDSGTAFSPVRFMGQSNEIRHARVLLHLRSVGYKEGGELMRKAMDFLLGKKVYVHPGDPDDLDSRIVWYKLNDGEEGDCTFIDEDDSTLLEYLDVYTTSSEPIHSGPDRADSHFFTATYNMVYAQKANIIEEGRGQVCVSGIEGVGNSMMP